jgi:hypothetical protein
MSEYLDLLARKAVAAPLRGLPSIPDLAPHLFPFQSECVAFGLRAGCAGIFLDTGLGKTLVELEWCRHAATASNGKALILTPLAVARQIEREAKRFGYDDVRVIREQSDTKLGTNICNYDRLDKLDPAAFGAVALDESSVLKNFTGKTTRALIGMFEGHRWKLSASATPAPNDHMELGQQCEFLSVMASNEMLARWFISDQTQMGRYRLRGHAVESFWDWMASWARMAEHPRDLGDDVDGFDLPPLRVIRHEAEAATVESWGDLFDAVSVSATTLHDVKRRTAGSRAATAAAVAMASGEPCVIWCDTDYEADALLDEIGEEPGVSEVRGSHPIERKEAALADFADGTSRVLISKPSVCGYGLNWQHCARMVFMGRSFSYESYYQAVRRCWRFGQKRPVDVHLVVADSEQHIGDVIDRKAADHARMKTAMVGAMKRAMGTASSVKAPYIPTHEGRLPAWL